jgi:hypothetical protein
LCLK